MNRAAALQGRLLDSDDRVRSEAVTVVCDLARYKLKSAPLELITRVAERLRDKKVVVVNSFHKIALIFVQFFEKELLCLYFLIYAFLCFFFI